MLETPHAIVGVAIATAIPNPLISIPLSFLSHFVLDMVPHWNPHLNTEKKMFGRPTKQSTWIVAGDVAVALVVGGALSLRVLPDVGHTVTILLCAFAAVLPDVIEGPYFFLNQRTKFIDKWLTFQKSIQNDVPIFWGLSTQVVTLIACFWWIFK